MSAAAMLRSAACRALQRPPASSFRHALFTNKETMPSRRLYSSDSLAKSQPSTYPHLHLLEAMKKSGHEKPKAVLKQRTYLTLEETEAILDRHDTAMKEFLDAVRDKVEHDRRNERLLRGAVLGGAIYMMYHFFGHQEADKETTGNRD